jgi:hypothetical protein
MSKKVFILGSELRCELPPPFIIRRLEQLTDRGSPRQMFCGYASQAHRSPRSSGRTLVIPLARSSTSRALPIIAF